MHYKHEGAPIATYSTCHKCDGSGMVDTGDAYDSCRFCASAGMGGNWSNAQGRFVSAEEALGDCHREKHGSADDALFPITTDSEVAA